MMIGAKGVGLHRLAVLVMVLVLSISALSPALGSTAGAINLQQDQGPGDGEDDEGFNVTISNLTFSKEDPREGENVTISITVRNNESITLPDGTFIHNVNITLMHFEEILFVWENVTLEGNSSRTFEFVWEAESGIQSFTAMMIFDIPLLDMSLPWDTRSSILEVDPQPIGNIHYPLMVLGFIFLVMFGAVVAPACFDQVSGKIGKR
ncbi:MAG: hypothetical protein ACOC55_02525 [Candidatus Natronoplasma sp.]